MFSSGRDAVAQATLCCQRLALSLGHHSVKPDVHGHAERHWRACIQCGVCFRGRDVARHHEQAPRALSRSAPETGRRLKVHVQTRALAYRIVESQLQLVSRRVRLCTAPGAGWPPPSSPQLEFRGEMLAADGLPVVPRPVNQL